MPRPTQLPILDWKSIFEAGRDWKDWLDAAESREQAARISERFEALALPEEDAMNLESISRPVHVVAIAEDWCGDVVRHAPAIMRIATRQPLVQIRFISRADRPDVFIRFLTNGGEAIPKFIFLSENWVKCGNWGPMQTDCRRIISRGKAAGNVAAAREIVSQIYQDDPGCTAVFRELCELVELTAATNVE